MFVKEILQKTRIIIIAFLILFNTAFLFAQDKKRVLFISSYHPSFPTFFKQIDGVKSILKDVQIDIEFMDSKRFDYDRADEMFAKYIKWKLKSLPKYDAIITSDDNALIFLLKYKELFSPNIPAVFLGLNNLDIALQQDKNPYITGVVETISMFDTLKLMDNLHRYSNKIIAIGDGTSSGKEDINKYKNLSTKFSNKKLEYISLENQDFDSFWEKLSQIDKNTPVLLLSAYVDKDGNRMNFNDSLTKIKQHLKAPLYHLWFHGMDNGILGGKLISHYYQGRAAAKIVLDILNGKKISEIKVKKDSPNEYFFDYIQLKQFNIEVSKLPKKSIILNKPISFYEENKILVWSIIGFIIFLFVIILIIVINIVKRKEAEKELKIANNSLEKRKKELETIIKEAPNPIILHQEDGKIILINQAWIDSSGYSLKETPTIDDWVNNMYVDIKTKTFIKKHIKTLYSITKKIDEGEFTFLNKNRDLVTWQFSSAPFELINGKRTVISSAMDITELKKKESMLRQQSKMASMGEMIGNIAHQWRQPLSIISSGATGMSIKKECDVLTDEEFKKICNLINDNAQYLSKTIDDFRNFLKNDRNFVEFNLKELFESFLNLVQPGLNKHHINLIINVDSSIQIKGYPNELIQCFINIFNNSKDVLEESSMDQKIIIIDTLKKERNIVISFKDNAGGIPQNILDRVFEPYFTTKHPSKGTGLGLSMTYNLITEGMKGTIQAKNVSFNFERQSYHGAKFIITLPIE